MTLMNIPPGNYAICRLTLTASVALLVAILLVPWGSYAHPDAGTYSSDWVFSKNPAGASKPEVSYYVPECDGTWMARIQNDGLRSMVLEVYGKSGGGSKILHQNFIFSKLGVYPSGVAESQPCEMSMGSMYEIVYKGFGGPRGSSATITSEFYPCGSTGLVLDESFTSWQTIDPDWSFCNLTVGAYRSWFDVSGGLMLATCNDVLVHGDYASYANWTHQVICKDTISISFDISLPTDCDQKSGWAGQVFWFVIYDSQGAPVVTSRFVMDNPWDTDHVGWVYLVGSEMISICGFEAGWHHVVYELYRGLNTWTAEFDGVVFEGLPLSSATAVTTDVGMIQFQNSLREDIQVVFVDNLRIESS